MDATLPTTAGAGSTTGGDDEEGTRIGLYLPFNSSSELNLLTKEGEKMDSR